MPMYNLREYSSNYSETKERLWFYSKVEVTNFNANIANANIFKSLKDRVKILGNTVAQPAPNVGISILKNGTIALCH